MEAVTDRRPTRSGGPKPFQTGAAMARLAALAKGGGGGLGTIALESALRAQQAEQPMQLSSSLVLAVGLAVSLAATVPAGAHGVRHQIEQARATVITLTYDDGTPLVGARFEAGPAGAAQATLSGQTDARGRAVVIADTPGPWQLRAFATDGHGARVEFDVSASAGADRAQAGLSGSGAATLPKWLGLVLIAAVFAALQQWLRTRTRRKKP